MTGSAPKFSVVVPAYNYGATLPTAIDSVLAQSRADVEIVLVDDASTDETPGVATRYGDRVRYLRNAVNSGHPFTWGRAMAEARGEYIVNLDADDWLLPGYFERMDVATELGVGFAVSSVYDYRVDGQTAALRRITRRDQLLSPAAFRRRLLSRIFFRTPGMLIHRSLVERSAAPDRRIWNADWEFLLRATRGASACIIAEPLAVYRIHSTSVSRMASANTDRLKRSCELFLAITRDPTNPAYLGSEERRLFARGIAELYLRIVGSRVSPRDAMGVLAHLSYALTLAGSEHPGAWLGTLGFFARAVLERSIALVLPQDRGERPVLDLLPASPAPGGVV